jgi:hypothetical protein
MLIKNSVNLPQSTAPPVVKKDEKKDFFVGLFFELF